MDEPLLVVDDVRKRYGDTVVLDGVSLALRRGELCALLGPSGSGKSTLLNIIGCLERPTSGRVIVAGEDTGALDDAGLTRLRGAALGFVFQFHHLLPAFTALENVMMPALARRGRPDDAMRARALEMLARVGLAGKAQRRPTQLSGGEQQRVAVARALAGRPALVLADEPTGNLDTHNAELLFELLRELEAELGTAFLVVTHDPRLAARCPRRLEILDGRIVGDARDPCA